jgi:hypothetical protein
MMLLLTVMTASSKGAFMSDRDFATELDALQERQDRMEQAIHELTKAIGPMAARIGDIDPASLSNQPAAIEKFHWDILHRVAAVIDLLPQKK